MGRRVPTCSRGSSWSARPYRSCSRLLAEPSRSLLTPTAPPLAQFTALLAYTTLGALNYRRACDLPGSEGDRALLLLLLCCSLSFGEMMARLLVLRLGWLKLPALPRAVVCQAAFRIALEFGQTARVLALVFTALVRATPAAVLVAIAFYVAVAFSVLTAIPSIGTSRARRGRSS